VLLTKGLTATIIFEAQSLNYDEGYGGNLSVLKKFHRGNGEVFSYSSRQSIRYSIFTQGVREFNWTESKVEEAGKGVNTVTQLTSDIVNSVESDLFGYMQTNTKIDRKEEKEVMVSRTSPVRILPAIALEPFNNDLEMLTNKYQSDKIQSHPNIANLENQRTLFRYSVCIDLHRIGVESDEIGTRVLPTGKIDPTKDRDFISYEKKLRGLDIGSEMKTKRVHQFLEVVGRLYRDIRGRREDLKPLFIVGGVYETFNPFFENIVNIDFKSNKKPKINLSPILQMLKGKYTSIQLGEENEIEKTVQEDTFIGIRDGFFANELSELALPHSENESNSHIGSPEFVILKLKEKVAEYYNSNQKKYAGNKIKATST
jgi:CRISPR-associated protein Cst2